ncbi:hypothetical protein ABH313_15445 [Chromobacterium vaccinii]|uniref:hypothetical protein n=1 Tax=Chromobacterium vaccinii TaxID=1108595 RepID=UPI0032603FC5
MQPKLPDPRSELQKSLSQGLQDYMQKLKVDLNRPVKRQSSEADAMQKAVLKQRVEGLRRMMMMSHDKGSLRALASELARLARELKDLVTSMTQNAADSQMAANVGGDQGAGDAVSQQGGAEDAGSAAPASADAASSPEAGSGSGADAAAAASEAGGATAAAQQAGAGQGAASDSQASEGVKEQSGSAQPAGDSQGQPVDPRAALHGMLSSGKGNPVAGDSDILEMQMTLKMVKEFIKQQMQQMKDKREAQDDLQSAEKALGDVDKILKGGPEAEEAMGEQMNVNISDVASNINVTA